jgi:hypothetical protein
VPLILSKVVDAKVMGNSANPWQKLALLVVSASLNGVYGLNKGFLKQIFRHVTILYN